MAEEQIKLVVWPRKPKLVAGKAVYQYVVVGHILSDRPLTGFEGNEVVVEGRTFGGIGDLLETGAKRPAKFSAGDASNVLVSLVDL